MSKLVLLVSAGIPRLVSRGAYLDTEKTRYSGWERNGLQAQSW